MFDLADITIQYNTIQCDYLRLEGFRQQLKEQSVFPIVCTKLIDRKSMCFLMGQKSDKT